MDQIDNPSQAARDVAAESANKPLGRQDLIGALDSEIADRESEVSRLGLSTWGLTGAFVGLLWMTINELLDNQHHSTETLLVFFCGFFVLGALRTALGETVTVRPSHSSVDAVRRFTTGRDYTFKLGVHPDFVPYLLVENLVLMIVAVTLGIKGFVALSVVSVAFLTILLIFLVIGFVMTIVRFPYFETPLATRKKPSAKAVGITYMAMIFLLSMQFAAICKTSATISKDDWRLGFLLAGLLTVTGLCARLNRPAPDLSALKSIRSRLAFGWVDNASAKNEIEELLLGLPSDKRLASMSIQLTSYIRESAHSFKESTEIMRRIIKWGADYETAADKPAFLESIRENLIASKNRMYSLIKTAAKPDRRQEDFERRLRLEIRIARSTGNLTHTEEDNIIESVDKALRVRGDAIKQMLAAHEESKPIIDKFMAAFGGKIQSKLAPLRWRDIANHLIGD